MGDATQTEQEATHREEFIEGLRALASAVEADPDFPIPNAMCGTWFAGREDPRAAMGRAARAFKRATGSRVKKEQKHGALEVRVNFGPVEVEAYSSRVCVRKQVGTLRVRREVPVGTRTEIVEEPIWEYECPPLLPEDAA